MVSSIYLWFVNVVIQIVNADYKTETEDYIIADIDETYYTATYSNTACLFKKEIDSLPSADALKFNFPEDSIFFVETSCSGGLDFRQACSVETAARAHPSRQINVLFAGRDNTEEYALQMFLKTLLTYKNVNFYKIHITDYAKGTPLEQLVVNNLKKSRYLLHHASDVIRFLTLYKFGGVYLDLDVFVVKSLDELPGGRSWVGRDTDVGLAVGLVALTTYGIGRKIANAIIKNLKENFKTDVWGGNGIHVITKALNEVCSMSWHDITPATCQGFKIFEPRYFYPIRSENYEQFLAPVNGSLNLTNVYAFHLWNYLINGEAVSEESLHAALTRKYCPKIDKINYKYSSYDVSSKPSHKHNPRQLRTLRVQRSRVDTLYNNIHINLKGNMQKHGKSRHKNDRVRSKFERKTTNAHNSNDKTASKKN